MGLVNFGISLGLKWFTSFGVCWQEVWLVVGSVGRVIKRLVA